MGEEQAEPLGVLPGIFARTVVAHATKKAGLGKEMVENPCDDTQGGWDSYFSLYESGGLAAQLLFAPCIWSIFHTHGKAFGSATIFTS